MRESGFSASLRKKLPGMCHRIENVAAEGTPDIAWIYKGQTRWIETKYHTGRSEVRNSQWLFDFFARKEGVSTLFVHHDGKMIRGFLNIFCGPSNNQGYRPIVSFPEFEVETIKEAAEQIIILTETKFGVKPTRI